ncbi:hypothetical protein [Spiroplasma eriocheiris]|uniref:Uncharacterized protein n=1 Tax=Spiroplasma eriocheiris TaxID=315358 RepID=A0A0H3XIC8_9MOLU|nr:hypothetical protein [Spiroplasma eriocheiris]AHF57765.1 hypothetical protein SPE_0637 [Spiroplasma eriocheiris CCTCC M 207170]AKM54215.1 hypothetical protein SERIO_v1c06450 [Spiroplasma eriocheiris]
MKRKYFIIKKNKLEIKHQEQESITKIINFLLFMMDDNPKDQELITQFKDIVMFYKNRIFDDQKFILSLSNKKESQGMFNLIKTAEVFPEIFLNFVINNITKIIELETFKICFSHWPQVLINKSQLIDEGYLSFMKDINKINSEKKVIDQQLVKYAQKILSIFEHYIVNAQKSKSLDTIINNSHQVFIQKLRDHHPNLLNEFAKIINTFPKNNLDNVNLGTLPRKKNEIELKKNQNQQHQEKLTNDKITLGTIISSVK